MKILAGLLLLVMLHSSFQGNATPGTIMVALMIVIALAGSKPLGSTPPPASTVLETTSEPLPSQTAQGIPFGFILLCLLLAPFILFLLFAGIGKLTGVLSRLGND